MKKYIILANLSLLFFVTTPAFALTPATSAASKKMLIKETAAGDKISKLKTRADAEIDRRIESLKKLITRLSDAKHLTADQKTSMTTDIQKLITDLTALKTKIAADTDIATLKPDVQSIVKDYRVYAIQLPKVHMAAVSDSLTAAITTLNALVTKLQTRIDEAKTQGNTVTTLQTALDDMKTKIADAQKKITQIEAAASALTPTGYPANKTTVDSTRALIQAARQDIKAAVEDAHTIQKGLRAFKPKTATTSATQ
jgi:chromosome segregation ATPase